MDREAVRKLWWGLERFHDSVASVTNTLESLQSAFAFMLKIQDLTVMETGAFERDFSIEDIDEEYFPDEVFF